MNTQLLQEEVDRVISMAGDPEAFHLIEDDLYVKVLQAIADGARNSKKLASIVLQTRKEQHDRWYA